MADEDGLDQDHDEAEYAEDTGLAPILAAFLFLPFIFILVGIVELAIVCLIKMIV